MNRWNVDRWDVAGGLGSALVAVGVGVLAGLAWAAIFVGALLMALYIIREVRH